MIICTEITGHKMMEEQLVRVNRALRVVGRCNEILVRSSDERLFLEDICRAIVEVEGYDLVWVGLAQQDKARTVRPVAHAGFEDGYLKTVNITWADTRRGKGPTGTAIRTGKPQVMRDIVHDPDYAPWRDEALKRGYSSSAALPMICEGQVIGALNVYSGQCDAFGPKELSLLMELAADLGYGISSLRNKAECDRLSQELLIHENMLKALSIELALAEERERHRIAGGIHDEISQKLVMAKFELQCLEHTAPAVSDTLSRLCSSIDEMIEDTRSLTFELSNPVLYRFGLSAGVESWLDEHLRTKYGINCNFVSNLSPSCFYEEFRVMLFQAVRELLTNIIKHAKARNVKVSMSETGGSVEIKIEDDGIGFDAAEILGPSRTSLSGAFGLLSVRERIEYMGGRFDLWSAPGKGTRAAIIVAEKQCSGRTALSISQLTHS